jgi:hypothetical protein
MSSKLRQQGTSTNFVPVTTVTVERKTTPATELSGTDHVSLWMEPQESVAVTLKPHAWLVSRFLRRRWADKGQGEREIRPVTEVI